MRTLNKFDDIVTLLRKPVFSIREAKAFGISASLLCYYARRGLLRRLGKGLYQAATVKKTIDFQWEELVLTAKSIPNGVICLVSALIIYELTDLMPSHHWIAVPNSTTKPVRPNTIIKRMRDMTTGKTIWQISGEQVPIFDIERTIIDSFRFLSQETALKALQLGLQRKQVNPRKLQDYAKKLRVNIAPYLLAMTL